MVTRQQVQGEYHVQSPEISSTNEAHFLLHAFVHYPEGRMSYQRHVLTNRTSNIDEQRHVGRILPDKPINIWYVSYIKDEADATSTRTSVIALLGIFLTTFIGLYSIYQGFPNLQEDEKPYMKIPWNLEDAKNLGTVLNRYKEDHFYHVYFGVCTAYIFLQTFAIPGSLFLSVLSGFLFSFPQAMLLVATCSAIGASLCFLISNLLGRRIITKYFPSKANEWRHTVTKHRDNLLNYIIFLRVTPFLPNWFINLVAPVLGVPLRPFALGTLIGVMPPSFVALQAGQTLNSMSADDAKVSWTSMTLLIVFGFIALLPIYFKERLRKKFE